MAIVGMNVSGDRSLETKQIVHLELQASRTLVVDCVGPRRSGASSSGRR